MTETKVIAEIGWNHMGDLALAEQMIFSASKAGATWAKFQTWDVKRLASGPWDLDGRREIYEKAQLSLEKHNFLVEVCQKYNIKFLSSVFSIEDAKLLLSIGQTAVKIPSFEIANRDLLLFCSANFSNLFVSTGTASSEELFHLPSLVDLDRTTVLHCVSSYPCPLEMINLPRIGHLKSIFQSVGFSDHTLGVAASLFALSYNIDIIERHFTVDNSMPGRDNRFAILPDELRYLVDKIAEFSKVNTDHGIDYQSSEIEAREIYRARFNHG